MNKSQDATTVRVRGTACSGRFCSAQLLRLQLLQGLQKLHRLYQLLQLLQPAIRLRYLLISIHHYFSS